MTSLCEKYIRCGSVEAAAQSLSQAGEVARLLAGGSDLLLELQQGLHPAVKVLVDVSEVEEMRLLEVRQQALFIGAAVTISQLANSSLVKQHAQALGEAARLMANPQVCNVATIGGNVAHALPAADGSIALLALDAQAEIADCSSRRIVPFQTLFKGPGETTLDPCGEVLVGFYVPLVKEGAASAFSRRVNPQGIALALLNAAIWLQRTGDCVEDIRIAVGPSGPVPGRMKAAEEVLRGQPPRPEVLARVAEAVQAEARLRDSLHRATAEYRRHLVSVLLDEAFRVAWDRSGS